MLNLKTEKLINLAVKEGAILTESGALCVTTGNCTGRSPNAKRIVKDSRTVGHVDWKNNSPMSPGEFNLEYLKFQKFAEDNNVYIQTVHAVRSPKNRLNIKVFTEKAVHSLFARNMFVPSDDEKFKEHFVLYHFPSLTKDPQVLINLSRKIILISGSLYSGEMKKSIFTALNYSFPFYGHLPMHCSVNTDLNKNNPAIFFGLSGTGKTTLSSDVSRILIGDDEHGWTDEGLTNFENGCYAKTIRLSKKEEPQIWDACHKKGTILENVILKDNSPDFDNGSITENARASYPTSFISGADSDGYVCEHPKNIIMLTCDAFGVLPPVAKLSPKEAVEQFLMGYTAKVAGTEKGVKEPVATFSPCFGLPFMPHQPKVYGKILKSLINKHKVNCWLVNTGWSGGPYGIGNRIPISITRDIIKCILDGSMANSSMFKHLYTGLTVPLMHKDLIPENILLPEKGWSDLKEYKVAVEKLMQMFKVKSISK